MFSKFFIERPALSIVMSIVIVLAGAVALFNLPIQQYPQIMPPQVVVSTVYPGANSETIAKTVASPLEEQINGVEDMLYINSASSASGTLAINVFFKTGTDPDMATINVNNRVQSVLSRLPTEVQRNGVTVMKRDSNFLEVVNLYSPDDSRKPLFLANYALINMIDDFKRIPGVGDARLFGTQDYAIRVWIDPLKLSKYNLTPTDVITRIQEQNAQFATGQLGQEPISDKQMFTYTITSEGRLTKPEEFSEIIIRSNPDGSALRLKNVATVELGAQAYNIHMMESGKETVAMGIFLQTGANALEVANAVQETLNKLEKKFPTGVAYGIPYDSTKFVKISIEEVEKTLLEAMLLVVLVVFVFLQKWRATLIPLLAIPVSIIGTFAGMYAFGFSINLLTLFGLVLAIGIVVDDAIVVVENVERHMQEGLSPREAAIASMKEVTSALVAIVLVLCAVFIPIAFSEGMSGVMYRQFAVTIVISVVISGFVALTLTPALCAMMLKDHEESHNFFFVWFNRFFESMTKSYSSIVKKVIKWGLVNLLLFGGLIYITYDLFKKIPTGLVPGEDQGYIITLGYLPPASSLSRTMEYRDKMQKMILNDPNVKGAIQIAGLDFATFSNKTDSIGGFVRLKDWSQRQNPDQKADVLAQKLMGMMMGGLSEGLGIAVVPPPIRGMSLTGGFEMYVQDRTGGRITDLNNYVQAILQKAAQDPVLTQMRTTLNTNIPQYELKVNKEKAKALGVSIADLFTSLSTTFGSYYVNDFNMYGKSYRVNIQAKADFRENPKNLANIFVRSQTSGDMIPLSTLVTMKRSVGPDIIERFNLFTAAKITGGPKPGFSSGEAMKAIERISNEVLPSGYTIAWAGSSYQEKALQGSGLTTFYLGILMVFLILVAQYERWLMPLAVISAVPFGVFGAAMAVYLNGVENGIYFQIGLIVLIGLSAKNAILIVEFAMQQEEKGLSIVEAVLEAAKTRLRPIIMTSIAFTVGVVPLVLSSGAGSASREAIGTGIIGGMLAATFIATLFIPMFYVWIARMTQKKVEVKK